MIIVVRKKDANRIAERKKQIIAGYLKRLGGIEMNFVKSIRPMFDKQQAEVKRKLGHIFTPKDLHKRILTKGIDDILFDETEQVQAFIKFERPLLTSALLRGAEGLFDQTGEDISVFDLQRATIAKYLKKQSTKFAEKVNDATIKQLRREMKAGLAAGESIPELATRVNKVYDMAKGYRAERMARTEMGSAINFGSWEGMMQSEVVESKEWTAVNDDRTRDDHADADGQVVGKNELFNVGGEDLMYPRDPRGSAGNIVNCRCMVISVIE